MSKVFVVSDTWFNRPLTDEQNINVISNNDAIISGWNESVMKDDIVYVLGGFGIADLYNIVTRLNGEIHFLDNYFNDDEKCFINEMKMAIDMSSDVTLKERIIFEDRQILTLNEFDSILSYFPLSDWCGKETGTYCFHGLNDTIDIASHNITCNMKRWNNIPVDIAGIQNSIQEFNSRISD